MSDENKRKFNPFPSDVRAAKDKNTTDDAHSTAVISNRSLEPTKVHNLKKIFVNVYLKHNHEHLENFVKQLTSPNKIFGTSDNGPSVSILQKYVLESTCDPIDMSSQLPQTTYRPNLFIRKNDAFGPWNFHYLLDLLELDYQIDENNQTVFPTVWKTNALTEVQINPIRKNQNKTSVPTTTQESKEITILEDDITLEGLLNTISKQNKYNLENATNWLKAFKGIHLLLILISIQSCTTDEKIFDITEVFNCKLFFFSIKVRF
jgi:hypothetical protein